jgi:hypothetical protein
MSGPARPSSLGESARRNVAQTQHRRHTLVPGFGPPLP